MSRSRIFPLFQSHIDLAHSYWAKIVQHGDTVIDATCGNGFDTLFLAKIAISDEGLGKVIALDIQSQAIISTTQLLSKHLPEAIFQSVQVLHLSHTNFPTNIRASSVKLIVYNLGYLPKGNKEITTLLDSTLNSLNNALELVQEGGAISLTCYPGHPEGRKEQVALLDFASSLSPRIWNCCHHQCLNRTSSPSLLLIQKVCF